jgi:phenylpropionate dioxygenase-like ring-hydroxylating dioxygenase large terminal subunit
MGHYTNNPEAVAALVRNSQVHRDVYIDPEIFDLEMKHLFANTWVYAGHDSQIPEAGDYIAVEIGRQPLLMIRHSDGEIHVLYNRCAHKGTKIVIDRCGNAGKRLRCPYHAWSYRTDGSLLSLPMQKGYDNTGFEKSEAAAGLAKVGAVRNYRGFVFVRLNPQGIGLEDFFGDALSSFDNMIDRSPEGRLEVAGPPLRYMHKCNWKMLVENQTDTCHPMIAHESSAGTAVSLWNELNLPENTQKPMAVEVIAPFMSSYEVFDNMGIRVWPNGHGHTGVHHSIHSNYSSIPGYFEQMVEAYGEERAKAILGENRHNTVYFPNIMIKGPIQLLRVFTPLAADRTLVDSYIYRLVGAPDLLLERTAMYNRLINAPTSVVGHDDLEMYERGQEGLLADGMDWVNIQRLYTAGETEDVTQVEAGSTERQMRNQFYAWRKFMLATMTSSEARRGDAA